MHLALQNAAKRKFKIVKRENNIPVLGVCEYCNAEFTADPETIVRPQDAQRLRPKTVHRAQMQAADASQCGVRCVSEGAENRNEAHPVSGTRKEE